MAGPGGPSETAPCLLTPLSAPMAGPMASTPYNGITSRSLGWKLRKLGDFMEGRIPQHRHVKRWDGAARTCTAWDSLRKDPELWYRDGNCFVHLYGKGQSRRGPAFKVPLGPLLDARCQPLINKYLSRDLPESDASELEHVGHDLLVGRVDLYIPPPPMADQDQALQFRLAMRNFFAWVYRRSMVGEHLGSALIELVNSMSEFRSPGVDIVEDTMSYLDEEGYLDITNHPNHALAMLHLAETFQLKDLYIDAFAHCVGMGEQLYTCNEYQILSSVTRKLVRSAKADMDSKLSQAGLVLSDFLEDELSATNLDLSAAGGVHLQRFRAFLLAFYTASLGHYPPAPVEARSTMWDPEVHRLMRADFEALYEYLVDETFTIAGSSPFLAERGITVLHCVNAFDIRHRYMSLLHPLPLLPQITAPTSRTLFPFSRRDKLRPDQRLVAHAALIKASNKEKYTLVQNHLVVAYKRFEEDSVYTRRKFDRKQKLSHVEGRKIRWILIYGILQMLRSCTDAPPEVRDTSVVNYSLAVSTANLPPWKEGRRFSSLRPRSIFSPTNLSIMPPLSRAASPLSRAAATPLSLVTSPLSRVASSTFSCRSTPVIMITASKYDSDSPGLAQHSKHSPRRTLSSIRASSARGISRTGSLISRLSQPASFRSSIAWLKGNAPYSPLQASARRPVYHEIVVHGYGNGTNDVRVGEEQPTRDTPGDPVTTPRRSSAFSSSPSPPSPSSSFSPHTPATATSSACWTTSGSATGDTTTTPRTEYSPVSWTCASPSPSSPSSDAASSSAGPLIPARRRMLDDTQMFRARGPASCSSSVYSTDEPAHPAVPSPSPSPPPLLPQRNSARGSVVLMVGDVGTGAGAGVGDLHPSPLRIRKEAGSGGEDLAGL